MNRKQRRQLGKVVGKDAASSIDLMVNIPDCCSVCQKAYDKKNKEMARTWFVDVFNKQKLVVLTCPECRAEEA